MAKAKFVYRGADRTVESVTRKSRQSGGLYDSYLSSEAQMFKAKEGESVVRILPPTWEDTEKWGDGWDIGVYLHFSVGPDNGAYLCLDKMKGETCPVCEARRKATDEDEADQLKPSYRSLCWVIDRNNEKAGPLVWGMPVSLFREINARSIDKKSSTPILVDDPEEGYDIVFNREGTNLKTKYGAVEVLREPSPLHDDERLQERWLTYIQEHPLPDMLVYFDAAHVEKVLYGKAERKAETEETEEPAERPSSRRRLRTEEPEEEAEVKPARRGGKISTGTPPWDGEETETEEAADPAPSRNARRRSLLDEADETEEPEAEIPRRGRRTAEPAPEEEEEEAEEAPRSGRRKPEEQEAVVGRARRALEGVKPSGRR